jgi:sterol-4alpha-carboxylate 3-dehydrogenase (decarboxylating)
VGAAAGCGVKKEQVKVIPIWVYYAMAVVAEWSVWMLSFGIRQSQVNRKMIRFFTMTNTFDISKAKTRLGYRPQWTTQEGIDKGVHALLRSQAEKKSV